jgi:hypothetical protein
MMGWEGINAVVRRGGEEKFVTEIERVCESSCKNIFQEDNPFVHTLSLANIWKKSTKSH